MDKRILRFISVVICIIVFVFSNNALAYSQRMIARGKEELVEKTTFPAGAYLVADNKLLLPIHQKEVNLDALVQNPQ
ncbi:hypothetical protein [Pedobacter sp. PACM 27299]|uniref:hypothetical protein n=1 Tax=Pedobacter sp. PACM 27299 TaxID=1727164 RepID=UPI0012FA58B5|nr:hypothetical protein [Pedobacter sp. PACM 27299]